jgi:hypothetical protein
VTYEQYSATSASKNIGLIAAAAVATGRETIIKAMEVTRFLAAIANALLAVAEIVL